MTAISACLIGKDGPLKEGIKSLLARDGFSLVEEYNSPAEITSMEGHTAQLVISVDEELDNLSKNIALLKGIYDQSRIVIISRNTESPAVVLAFDAGADALISQDISCEGLIGSLKLVAAGEKVYPARPAMPAANGNHGTPERSNNYNLSRQELKIVGCLTNGEPNKVIAYHLNITEATVKVHVRTILRKLGTRNRTEAAILAISQGLAPARGLVPPPVPPQALTA